MQWEEDYSTIQVPFVKYENYNFLQEAMYDGFKVEDIQEHAESVRQMATRDDDVLIMTYPKSGEFRYFPLID